MTRMGFYVDLNRCVGCRTCEAACDLAWGTSPEVSFRQVGTVEGGQFPDARRMFLSLACHHCDEPACAEACPTNAYVKRDDDGVVIVDTDQCIGCKMCTYACPYGAPQYDEAAGVVRKCHFCQPLIDQGEAPRCVESCPYDALDYGPIDDLLRRHPTAQRSAPFFPDPSMTRPNILFDVPEDAPTDLRRVDRHGRLADLLGG